MDPVVNLIPVHHVCKLENAQSGFQKSTKNRLLLTKMDIPYIGEDQQVIAFSEMGFHLITNMLYHTIQNCSKNIKPTLTWNGVTKAHQLNTYSSILIKVMTELV
jgi:hypothetical protein